MRIYLAGPLGFSETGRAFQATLVEALAALGHEVLDPWQLTDPGEIAAVEHLPYGAPRRDAWRQLNRRIGGNNRAALDRCDAMFAVLDGVDVDSGTAAEIGYAAAKGKTILGYRGDSRLAGDNEGAIVNLQVEYFIRDSGGNIVTTLADLPEALAKITPAIPGDKPMPMA